MNHDRILATAASQKPAQPKHGQCPLCRRVTDLTYHHLIPRKMHRRAFFKKNYSKHQLAEGIAICRLCHSGIHKTYTEMELAKAFDSVEKLLADETLSVHFNWVSKQRRR
ncbi:hypothetical protein [Alteromonas oceanisediminis]|uniref:hypothetical protein n=1 Tax=Alteromonas oceanisediminis TaxID=2836180 RepID=UPI001BD970AD|nr:hypothetical protein [Alteromonas oceanisediminis]MBT0586243.1 hypothetical protein [Alteromonas oceanisediminis]